MKLTTFLSQTNLEHSLLLGYYGGGNYGDELLLEVLQNLLSGGGVKDVVVAYKDPRNYASMHHDFGYKIINIESKQALTRAALRSKKIVVGGGGLWGVDMNANTFMLSAFLWVCRWLLHKKVYLLGVGYYRSTTPVGRVAAWLAGKAANLVLARDTETHKNFSRITSHVYWDVDIAWYVNQLDLGAYEREAHELDKKLKLRGKTIFMAPRRWQAKRQQATFGQFNELLAECAAANKTKDAIIALAESESKGPELYRWARGLRTKHRHVRLLDFAHNPLALFLFFKKHHKDLSVIAPQLHIIATAHLTKTSFMPLVYDNKVHELLKNIGVSDDRQLPINRVTQADLQASVDAFYGSNA
ncbi:MAG TPA: polysaccharide pyruvyl transferase family protein [Patescibacteria group bacterium]|nr:polysaccharide pyruvyl transferase family protein [Patescibacteria group bacterium]